MKNSRTAIRELTAKYRSILKKCAFLNAICLLGAVGVANAGVVEETVEGHYFDVNGNPFVKNEEVYTITGTETMPVVDMTEDPIIDVGTTATTATVTQSGDLELTNNAQLNVEAGSALNVSGTLTNNAKTYVVGDVGLDYDGPRYVQIYNNSGEDVRDTNAYPINNHGTITADEIRNYDTIINYVGSSMNGNVYNILVVDGDGDPVSVAAFENAGTITGNVSNSAKFMNAGIINGNVSNTGTMTSPLGNITGTIDNGYGILNTWGDLDRDLNGTVELQYNTQLAADKSVTLDAVATNTGTFAVAGNLTVNNTYSNFSNFGTMTIADTGRVTSNIYNTGVMDNEGLIIGDVTNAANATLTTALDTIDGTLTNEGYLNTYGALKQDEEDFADDKKLFGGTVNLVGSSTVTTSDVKLANVNLSSDLEVSKELKADNLTVTEDGELIVDGTGKITGQVANSGVVTNNGTFNADVVNDGTFDNEGGQINSGTFVNNGTLSAGLDAIASTTVLTNNGSFNTWGVLDKDIEGTVNLVDASSLGDDVTLETVNLSHNLDVAKELTVDSLTVSSDATAIVNVQATGAINGDVVNAGTINNSGEMSGTMVNNGTYNNSNLIDATITNNGTFNNNAGATVEGNLTNNSTVAGSFVNDGVINAAFENNGSAQNNNVINGDVANNSFLYNNAGASITSDITNNGSIQNLSVISGGNLTNNGIVYNQTTNPNEGIIDTDISNSGILINSGSITNTVTDSAASDPSISNSHTILNYGDVQAKNFTNAGVIHNLGVMGDNTSNDETIATTYSSFDNLGGGNLYNNRMIKVDTFTNAGIVENYDTLAVRTLTNDATFRNEGSIGSWDDNVTVNNNGSLYNAGTIYGDVTNNAGAELTSPIYTISGMLTNNGILNTWGNLESVNPIALGGTTNLIYDSDLKQDITAGVVNVKDASTLNLGTNKLTANTLNIEDNSSVALNVTSGSNYGSVAASNYTVGTGTELTFVLDRGIVTPGTTIIIPVFTDLAGNATNLDFGTVSNNRYQITKEANGAYKISYMPSGSGNLFSYGGDENVVRASVAWLDEGDMPEGSDAAKIQEKLHTLAQVDTGAFVKQMRSLMPETAPVGYALANSINNKIAEAVEGRFMARKLVKREEQPCCQNGRSGGDIIAQGKNGSVWVKALYDKMKLNTNLGFDAKTNGVVFGVDGKPNDELTVGAGYAYAVSDVDSKSRKTDVATHIAMLYSEYLKGQYFVNGVVNYNRSKYKEKRNVVGYNVKSDYTSDVAFARIMNGFHIPVKYFVFTPEAGLRYLWMKVNGYTDNIGQTAGDRSTYSLTGVIGMKFGAKTKLIGFDKIMFWPEVAVRGTYDFIKADNDVFVNLPNNSAYKIKGETLDRLGLETAAKLGILSGNIDVSLEYLGRYRKNYNDHTGLISFKYHF